MRPLLLATTNLGKLREFQIFFKDLPDWDLRLKPIDVDVEETGLTFMDNAIQKASGIARATQHWSLGDDSGLVVDALGGAPGVFSARYAETDADRIARVLHELNQQDPKLGRKGTFVCAIALCDPQGTVVALAEGKCEGEILFAPQGSGGFGYDPIFWLPQLGATFAELSPEKKDQISHRGKAFAVLRHQLLSLSL
jgi:XTP/dITP diphosphohydrolase